MGVAIGFARKSDGTTALAAVVGYLVFDRVTKVMFFGSAIRETVVIKEAQAQGIIEIINYGMQNPTKVLGGIMMGLVTALLWQRFYRIKLPSWLAFFGGRRFVPIVTSFAALVLGVLIGWIWPTLGEWIGQAGEVLTTLGPLGTGLYGLINRLLIPSACTTSSTPSSGTWCRSARSAAGCWAATGTATSAAPRCPASSWPVSSPS